MVGEWRQDSQSIGSILLNYFSNLLFAQPIDKSYWPNFSLPVQLSA